MAIEETQKGYYDDAKKKWIDINLSVKCCVSKFLAEVLFKNGYSRVVYAMTDSVFRRRIETLDKGKTGEELLVNKFRPTSLELPFGAFNQSDDWQADDRPYAQNASQAIYGIYDMTIYKRLRILPCKSKWKVTLYYSRRDDVKQAAQRLYWEQEPKHPVWMYCVFNWKGNPVAIPANITIESINTKPEWEELKFLESQRIFPIEVELTVRSYQVVIPTSEAVVTLPYRWQHLKHDDDADVYITEETVLEFVNERWNNIDVKGEVDTSDAELNAIARKYFESDSYTEEQITQLGKSLVNGTTYDIIKGFYTETTEVALNSFIYYEPTSTPTKAVIKYAVKPADYKFFEEIVFIIPGQENIVVKDCKQKEVVIEGLQPSSTYDIVILTKSTTGNITTFNLSFTTKDDPNNQAPTPEKINKKIPGLIGMNI